MNLVVVEILERQAGVLEHGRNRVGGRHEQAFLTAREIDGPCLAVAQMRQHRQIALRGPLVGCEQDGARAVGERRAVACSDRALGIEARPQLRQLFDGRVGTDVVVLVQPQRGDDQVAEEAIAPGRCRLDVALVGHPVLILARDAPALGHELRTLAHGQTGARLDHCREHWLEVPWAQAQERRKPLCECAPAVALEEQLLVGAGIHDRRVADGVGAARNSHVDLPEGDFVADEDGRLEAGSAGALQVEPRSLWIQTRGHHALAREVIVLRVLDDRAGRDVSQPLALELEPLDDTGERRCQHVLVGCPRIGGVGPCEGDAYAADDRDAPDCRADEHGVSG